MKWVSTEFPVRYSECDPMGVVHHSNYFVWLEMGRIELARVAGFKFERSNERMHLPVIDIRCQYKESARFGNTIIVETALKEPLKAMLEFEYRVLRKFGRQLLAIGYSVHVLTTQSGQILFRIPDDLNEKINLFLGGR